MEKITSAKVTIITVIGAIGSFIANLFGGWTNDLATLIIMMGIDFTMGLLIAAVWKKSGKSENGALSSWSAWKGLCRKGVSLLFVLIAYRLDLALGVDYIRTAVIIGFIVNELISIVENAGIMGIPIPGVIARAIDLLRNKSEGDNSGTD
jgi:toxin secretion/phage lysis holin